MLKPKENYASNHINGGEKIWQKKENVVMVREKVQRNALRDREKDNFN